MNMNEYQRLAMRTNDKCNTDRLWKKIVADDGDKKDIGGILNGCLGLSGEVGEFNDMVKKAIFHEKQLDEDHAKREASDILWYLAMICESFGWDMDEIANINIEKLRKRYPDGFNVDRANNREEGDV